VNKTCISALIAFAIIPQIEAAAPAIKPPAGRLAVVADGNSPDPDDIGATAVSLALLQASGMASRLVYYSHSCDLVRGPKISAEKELERQALMQTSCDGTARRWGGFGHLTFWNCVTQKDEAIAKLRDAINASTAADPLWIIEAGEPDIIVYALQAADPAKRGHVSIVTHHRFNDASGDFFKWKDVLALGVTEVRIPNQNIGLKTPMADWDWAKEHSDMRIQWIWEQGKIAEQDAVVEFQKGDFDFSDAGMILYWLTGATAGGLKKGTTQDVREILLSYVETAPVQN
jgi:hypothetical protein